jgi:hypothetical protein
LLSADVPAGVSLRDGPELPGWYGEGDDFFFIDGEHEPRLHGTGTED